MNTKEKILTFDKEKKEGIITVTHITVRQSIFFLVLKLLFLEAVAASAIIVFHLFLTSTQSAIIGNNSVSFFNVPLFLILVVIKTGFMIYVIVQWLEEYYEITPKEVVHRKGFIMRKEEHYTLDHIGSIKIEQGLFGRIFNFGSLKLFDWALEEDVYIYLIHSPLKYNRILQTLIPEADIEKKVFREKLIDEDR